MYQPMPSLHQQQKKKRRLHYVKCFYCRKAKKKCTPIDRQWPAKCDRCIEEELPCTVGTDERKNRRAREQNPPPSFFAVPAEKLERRLSQTQRSPTLHLTRPLTFNSDGAVSPTGRLLEAPDYALPITTTYELPEDHGKNIGGPDIVIASPVITTSQELLSYNPVTPVDDVHTFDTFLRPLDDTNILLTRNYLLVSEMGLIKPVANYLTDIPRIQSNLLSDERLYSLTGSFLRLFRPQLPSGMEESLGHLDLANQILQIAIYQLVNGLTHVEWYHNSRIGSDLEFEAVRIVVSYLQQAPPSALQRICSWLPEAEFSAFKTNLLDFALKVGASRIVQAIFQFGIAGEELMIDHNFFQLSDFSTMKVALKAIISKGVKSYSLSKVIEEGFGSRDRGGVLHDACELLDFLYEHNLATASRTLRYFLSRFGPGIIEHVLIKKQNIETIIEWVQGCSLATIIAERHSEDELESVFKVLLSALPKDRPYEQGYETEPCKSCKNHDPRPFPHQYHICYNFSGALCIAISRKHWKVVDVLLRHQIRAHACSLIHAIRAHNTELVRRLLWDSLSRDTMIVATLRRPYEEFEVWLDPVPTRSTFEWNTPYAEAIRSKSRDVQVLFGHVTTESFLERHNILSCLVAAAEAGDISMVKRCLKHIPEAERMSAREVWTSYINSDEVSLVMRTSLIFAIRNRNTPLIIVLADAGARVGTAEVRCAISTREEPIFNTVLRYYDWPISSSNQSENILRDAVGWENVSVVKALLRHPGFRSCTTHALGIAISRGNQNFINILLESGLRLSRTNQAFCSTGNCDFLKDVVETNNTALLQEFLSRGADPCCPMVLDRAVRKRNHSMIRVLLAAIIKRYPVGNGSFGIDELTLAIHMKDVGLVSLLAEHLSYNSATLRSHRDMKRWPDSGRALGTAVSADTPESLEMVQILLEYGADPNEIYFEKDPWKRETTAFLAAVKTNDVKKVELLLNHNAKVNLPAEIGIKRTPLQAAAELGSNEMIYLLLRHGADPNLPAAVYGGATALQLAAIKGYINIAELLIDKGADIHAPPAACQGRTPFEGAAEHGRMDMMKFLIHQGALDRRGDGGEQIRRAIELANKNKKKYVVKFIESFREQYKQELGRSLGYTQS